MNGSLGAVEMAISDRGRPPNRLGFRCHDLPTINAGKS